MKKTLILLFVFFYSLNLLAGPKVPSVLYFADLKLHINATAQRKIQEDVDRLTRSQSHFNEYVKKADIYFPLIEQAFEAKGVPTDFKYLVIQESAMNAEAVSSSKAVGYWQFKAGTAIEVGMTVGNGIDERKNIIASSLGAAEYLKRNNRKLDNWIYALISYNKGLGGVQSEVKNKYVGAKKMDIDGHTHWYALKFLAHYIAFKDAVGKAEAQTDLYGYTEGAGHNLKHLSKKLGVPLDELHYYNKWISTSKKIPADKVYQVVVPGTGKKPLVVKNEPQKEEKEEEVRTIPDIKNTQIDIDFEVNIKPNRRKDGPDIIYTDRGIRAIIAKADDTPHTLSNKGGISHKKFLKYNEMRSFEAIEPGEAYYLQKKKAKALVNYHVVEEDESLWDIAQEYGMRIKSIRKKNRMRIDEALEVGRVLWLRRKRPKYTPVEVILDEDVREKAEQKNEEIKPDKKSGEVLEDIKPANKELIHVVEQGQTLYSISRKYDVSVDQIKEWNGKLDNSLDIGEHLVIKK